MSFTAKKIIGFWILYSLFSSTILAQIVLTPKPDKAQIEREKRRNERRLATNIPAKGWHFESSVGTIVWGKESECNCNALTGDLGMYYLNPSGFVVGTQLILTNTISSTLTPTFKLGYQQINDNGTVGVVSTSLIAGRSIGNIISRNSSSADKYVGFMYGGEIGFHPDLGRNAGLKGVFAFGWLTHRETFNFDRFGGPSETKMTHSGFRLRFGISF